ncbi:MAG TPA: hypothetical protein VMH89_14880, partial [Candidatus Acidoferrum sp.]|nr:hypothetical protein [Candidatus Acidoferrum sp.]
EKKSELDADRRIPGADAVPDLEINGAAIQEHIGGNSSDGETEPTLEKNLLRKSGRGKKVRTKERREREMCFRVGRVCQV